MSSIDGGRSGYRSQDGSSEPFANGVANEHLEVGDDSDYEIIDKESDDENVSLESDDETVSLESDDETVKQESDDEIGEQKSGRKTSKPEPHDGIVKQKSDNTALTQSAPKQLATPISSLPSVDDLHRMERWMALQERMANLNGTLRQGHTYGKLTVTGNARAIRGNIYEDSASLPCLRNHTYGKVDAKEGGMIWEGDISIAAFNDFMM